MRGNTPNGHRVDDTIIGVPKWFENLKRKSRLLVRGDCRLRTLSVARYVTYGWLFVFVEWLLLRRDRVYVADSKRGIRFFSNR